MVKFEYGTEAELSANDITQSIYSQCDPDDNQFILLDSIIDFDAVQLTYVMSTRN